jgi:hypothetical protein
MANDAKTSVSSAIGAVASLIPYVGQVAALVPAITTLTGFVADTIQNYHHNGEMTDQERADFQKSLDDIKLDPAMLTDAERGIQPSS